MEIKQQLSCPKCGLPAKLKEKRLIASSREVYRKYGCVNRNCDHIFFTIEFEAEENDDFIKAWEDFKKWN